MWSMLLVVVAAFICCSTAQNEGTYTIVAPKVLRPSLDYHVSISLHGIAGVTNLVVAIEGLQDGGGPVRNSQSATVDSNSTQVIKFQIGELGPGKYNLTARGNGGLNFFNTTELEYAEKSHSVFIQTDKAIYKPGQTVQFRVIVVNPQLKPSVTGSMDVFMTDGKGNRIKQWNRVFTKQGVFSSELPLSDQPVLGDWNITAVVSGQTTSKVFQVAEYILPKFEVTIDLPSYLTFNESKMVATIKAKYTYGKPVKGNVTIAAYPQYRVSYIQPFFTEPVRKTVQIDGKVDVDFNLFKELKLVDDFERDIRFDVTVIEGLTERKQNTSSLLTLYKYKYKMELIKTSDSFKPGLKYTAFLKLAYQDNTPIQDANGVVIIKHGFSHNQDEYNRTEYPVPRNGILELNFYPPVDENVYTLGIEAQYQDLVEWFSTINRAQSASNSFIQAVLRTDNAKVNEEVAIEVNSTAPLDTYVYEVMGRGNLVLARTVQAGNQRSHTFRFQATPAMAPVARVVVYYVRADGEVVADALNFDVEGTFQNFVEVRVAPDSVEPGKTVDISVKAKPNSYVGVLGVDQSVLLLKTGNDITQNDVLEEVKSYDSARRPDFASWLPEIGGRSFWWPSSATAGEVFSNSGTVVLTNGYVQESMPFVTWRSLDSIAFASANVQSVAVDNDASDAASTSNTIRVRRQFPEVWLFNSTTAGTDGTARFVKEAPDTITSWVITAFSLDAFHGLGVIQQPTKMQVFRPFFIQLNLPYSVIRGEVVAIQAIIFNYMSKEVTADLTFENIGDFQFIDNSVNDNELAQGEAVFRKKSVRVPAQDGTPISFLIRPTTLGNIDLRMTAKTATAGDAVVKKLLVKAEGETIYKNKAYLLDLRSSRSYTNNVTVSIPFNAVPGSESIELSAIADIMGPSINNLNTLLRMPFGCGEQNMLLFVPNIVVTEYLRNTGQLTDAISAKALGFMETGYQKELTYKRDDGSFSAFGKSDAAGSTWLTAFVARSFRQAQPYIAIEDKVIDDALRWLSANQAVNGSFPEVGKVSHTDMQGGSGKGVPLTAYVLLAFLENKAGSRFGASMNMAVDFLTRELPTLKDPYALALVTYVLHLAENPSRDTAFDMLQAKANNSIEEFRFWAKPRSEKDKTNPWSSLTQSVDVEMTAYSLLTYLQRGLVTEALPIMRWMVAQRNSNGGFASTQDTVIGLYALAKLAEKITVPNTNINVKIKHNTGAEGFSLSRENAMVLQKFKLPPKTTQVEISAVGSGFAIIQVSTSYNLNVTGEWPMFTLDPQLFKNANQNRMQLTVCSSFVGEESSNMAVMEISLPSGYVMDDDSLPSLRAMKDIKRVETNDGGTGVSLYFDKMTKHTVCPAVLAYRVYKVAEQHKVPVVMYDYYDNSRRARAFYEPIKANICDICQSNDCKAQCSSYPGWNADEDGSAGWGNLDSQTNNRVTGAGQESLLPTFLCIVLSGLTSALLLI